VQFAVGFVVDAEDPLIAALKVKMQRPEAPIAYVRQQVSEATPVTPCADSTASAHN
jgi:hypothetical protein